MFKKTPLILALGLALATQAGAQVVVTPGDGTQIVTGTVESGDDVTTLFGPADDTTNLHLTFNENVFTPEIGLPGHLSHAGEITMVSTADGHFFRGPLFIYNSPKITINKTSSSGAVFFADGEEGDRFLDTEDRLQSSSRLGSIIVSNTGGSVIDVTGTSRQGFDSDHIVFESTAEDAATIKATNGRNFTPVAPNPEDQTFSPIRGGVDFEGVSQEPNTTDITIKGAKTAIDLDNTLLTVDMASTSITGSVSLKNSAHAIFGGISDDDHDALVAVVFKPEAYVDAEKLNSLEQLFNNQGWNNQSLTFKGTEASPVAIDLTNSHIIGNAVNIEVQAGTEDGRAISLISNSTAAFLSKDLMTVKGSTNIDGNATMSVLSQGTFKFTGSINNSGTLWIKANSLVGTGENAGLTSNGNTTLNVRDAIVLGGDLSVQAGSLTLSPTTLALDGGAYVGQNASLSVNSPTVTFADSIVVNSGTLSINANSLTGTGEQASLTSSGTTTLNVRDSIALGGGLAVAQGSLSLAPTTLTIGGSVSVNQNTSLNVNSQTASFASGISNYGTISITANSLALGGMVIVNPSTTLTINSQTVDLASNITNRGNLSVTANSLTGGENASLTSYGTTTLTVADRIALGGGLSVETGSSLTLSPTNLEVGSLTVYTDASLNVTSQTVSFANSIFNEGILSITANSLTGTGENANLTSNGTTTLAVSDSITLGGYLDVQSGSLELSPTNLEIAGGVHLNPDTSLAVTSDSVTIGTGIENNGTLSITANSLGVTGENPMLVSQGSTTFTAHDSLSLGGNVLVKTGTLALSAPNIQLNGRMDGQANTTVTLNAQTVSFTQPFKNFGVLSITADSLVGTGDSAEFKSNGDTTITVAKDVVIGGELDAQAGTLTLTAESLQVNDLIHVHPDATLHITTKELSSANGINNHGALMTIQADTLKSNGLMIQGTTEINVAKDANLGRTLIVHAGSLDFTAGSVQVDGPVTVEPNTTLELNAKTMTVAGSITNQGGAATLTVDKLVAQQGAQFTQGSTTLTVKEVDVTGDLVLGGEQTQLKVTDGSLHADNVIVNDGAKLDIKSAEGATIASNITTDATSKVSMELGPKTSYVGTLASSASEPSKGMNITMSEGSSLHLTGESTVSNLSAAGGALLDLGNSSLNVDSLTMQTQQLNLKASNVETAHLAVATLQQSTDGPVNVNLDLFDAQMPSTPDEGTGEALAELISVTNIENASGEAVDAPIQITAVDGVNEITVLTDRAGNVNGVTGAPDPVAISAREATSSQMMAWRTQINDVNKRMGDLRTYGDQAYGGWVRMYGAKTKLKNTSVSTKSNTVQVGFDTKINDRFYFGVTGLYTDGESRVKSGLSDDKSYGFGVYGGWFADNGQFVDVILKQFHVNSDLNLAYRNGRSAQSEYSAWGTSISAEYGWRLGLTESNRFWVEPQAEVSYGRLGGDTYVNSSGVTTEQDSVTSVIGRLGVAFGTTFDKGSAYVKASVAHDWDGKTSATVSRRGTATQLSEDLGGTWGEFAFGGTVNFTKNFAGYAEFQTTTGSKVKTPYQWNLGARYMF